MKVLRNRHKPYANRYLLLSLSHPLRLLLNLQLCQHISPALLLARTLLYFVPINQRHETNLFLANNALGNLTDGHARNAHCTGS